MLKFVIHSYYLQVSKTKQQLMRKVLLPLILLAFFLPSSTSAQKIKLSKDKYDIKLPEGNVHFRFHEQKLTVKFNDGISEEAIQEYLAATGLFQEYSKDWIIPAPLTHRPVLKAGVTYEQAAEVLKQSADVRYVAPVVMYKDEEQSLYDLFYVRVKEDGDLAILRDLAKQFNFAVEGQFPDLKRVYTCRINKSSAGNTFEIAKHIQSLNKFEWAEPDFIYTCQLHTNDPFYNNQWGINNTGQYAGATSGADMDVVNAWGLVTGSSSISVAIHDCWGASSEFTHPDLSFAATYDAVGTGFASSGFTGDAHGINCAGIISATANNSIGAVGVAYGTQVKAVKIGTITTVGGSFTTSGTIRATATIWSYQNADIISNSTGGGSSNSIFDAAIADALTYGRNGAGTLFFSSNGNSDVTPVSYPASNTNTVAVAATSFCDVRKSPNSCSDGEGWGSNYGTGNDVGAPGIRWYSTDIVGSNGYSSGDYYAFMNGTSAACPAAAAVGALCLSINSTLSAANLRWAIETTAEKVGGYTYTSNVSGQPNGTWSSELGHGRVNAYLAVQAVNCTGAPNDNCANAVALPLNASCSYTNGTLCRATQSIAPSTCSGFTANRAADVWYTVTPSGTSGTGVTLTCVSGASTDVILGIYSGSCTGLTLVQCVDATTLGGTESMTVTGLTSGTTYYVRVYDWYGSTLNTSFQICATQCGPTTAAVTPVGPVTLCSGNSQTLTVSNPCTGCTYLWSNGGTGTTTSVNTAGNYTVTGTNTCGTSVASNTVAVTVNPLPVTPTVTPTGPVTLCAGQSQTLTITNPCTGCTFAWSGGGTGTTKSVNTTSTNTVTATNSCGTSAASNSVSVTVNPLPVVPTVTPAGPVTLCAGQSQTLTISNPCTGCTFNWSNGGTGTTQSINTTSTLTATSTNSCGTSANSNSVAVTVNPLPVVPTVTPTGPVDICTGQSQTLTITNPCTGCTFAWSGGGTGTTKSVNTTSTNTVTATNSCGTSSASNSVTVTVNPAPVAPTVTPAGPLSICSGQSQTLTISNPCTGCTFDWSNGGTGTTTSVNTAGTYTATATTMCGTSTASNGVVVSILPLPVTPVVTPTGPVDLCSNQSQLLTISNPCTGCTFDWSNSATGSSTTVNTAGTYSATSTNSCGTSASSNGVAITVTTQPNDPTGISATSSGICLGTSSTLTVNGVLTTGATWRWYTGSCGGTLAGTGNNIVVSPTTATTYYVRAENGICMSACAQQTINVFSVPTANAGADQAICSGSSVQVGTTGVVGIVYSWSPSTGLSNPNVAMPNASPSATTTYTLIASNSSGCADTDQVLVTVNALPFANAGPDVTTCAGFPMTIGTPLIPGLNYDWLPATGLNSTVTAMPNASPLTATTYTVTVTNPGTGCVDQDVVTVSTNPVPTADAGNTVTVGYQVPVTIGGNPTATGTGPFTYSWAPISYLNSPNASNPTSTPDTTTTYTVTITDANGCTDEDTITVFVIPPCKGPTAAFTASQLVANCPAVIDFTDQSLTSGATSYQWTIYVNGGAPMIFTNQHPTGLLYLVQGAFSAQLIVTDTCGTDTLLMPGYINITCPVNVNTASIDRTIEVFPNPTSDVVNVTAAYADNGEYNLVLQNVLGQTVYSRKVTILSNQIKEQVSLAPYASGVYMLQLKGGEVNLQKKIEKR